MLEPIIKPIFHLPGEATFPVIMSFLSGYPLGAKLTSRLRSLDMISKPEGDRLITLASTSGPLFILGAVLTGMLSMPDLSGLMIIPHYMGALTVGLIFSRLPRLSGQKQVKQFKPSKKIEKVNNSTSLPDLISRSVKDSVNSILLIGGFVIIYNVIIDMVLASQITRILIQKVSQVFMLNPSLLEGILAGLIELTTGCNRISLADVNLLYKILGINFIIGWGGLSILSQAISFISQTDISVKLYLISKLLHGFLATLYTYLLYLFFYRDYLNVIAVGNPIDLGIFNLKTWLGAFYSLGSISLTLIAFYVFMALLVINIKKLKKS